MLNVAVGFLIFLISLNPAGAAKPSLKQFCQEFQQPEKVSALFKESIALKESPQGALAPILALNQKSQQKLLQEFRSSSAFVRGEIEDEKSLDCTIKRLQLSLLEIRSFAFSGKWQQVQEIFSDWFTFAADFPYEESSLVGLRLTGVMRALLLDEFERIQSKFSAEIAQKPNVREWFSKVRAPWPVDRVLVVEAKRLLKPPLQPLALALAGKYQKNPYLSSEKAMQGMKGAESKQAELLKAIWRESDIQMMKTEMNRIGILKIRLASAEFFHLNKKEPQSAQELVTAGLLDSVPIDYFTGQSLSLTSQLKH